MMEQHVIFRLNDNGELEWSKLTPEGIASTDYADDDAWYEWQVVSEEYTLAVLLHEIGRESKE